MTQRAAAGAGASLRPGRAGPGRAGQGRDRRESAGSQGTPRRLFRHAGVGRPTDRSHDDLCFRPHPLAPRARPPVQVFYKPYFYVLVKEERFIQDCIQTIRRRFEDNAVEVTVADKEDLDMPNHLSGKLRRCARACSCVCRVCLRPTTPRPGFATPPDAPKCLRRPLESLLFRAGQAATANTWDRGDSPRPYSLDGILKNGVVASLAPPPGSPVSFVIVRTRVSTIESSGSQARPTRGQERDSALLLPSEEASNAASVTRRASTRSYYRPRPHPPSSRHGAVHSPLSSAWDPSRLGRAPPFLTSTALTVAFRYSVASIPRII